MVGQALEQRDEPVVARTREQFSVFFVRKNFGQRSNRLLMPFEDELARRPLKQADKAVSASCEGKSASAKRGLRREGITSDRSVFVTLHIYRQHVPYGGTMLRQDMCAAPGFGVPDARRAIPAPAHDPFAVGGCM
jgi:hypothetical protein